MRDLYSKKYILLSGLFHFLFLFILVLSFDFATPLPVIENTSHHDVISAVVLGDSPKSKVLATPHEVKVKVKTPPVKIPAVEPAKIPVAEKPPAPKPKPAPVKKEAIALKKEIKKQPDSLAKELLADIKKQGEKQKKIKQKQLTSQFKNAFKQQAEQSLRQQLLNEEIKLQGKQTRQSQGVVNKYKALILQAISEHWIIPPQAKKNKYCQLLIRLAPDGTVLSVHITKTSGDTALDSSARLAVLKASPLPVPSEPAVFSAFQEFALKVKPENILASGSGISG